MIEWYADQMACTYKHYTQQVLYQNLVQPPWRRTDLLTMDDLEYLPILLFDTIKRYYTKRGYGPNADKHERRKLYKRDLDRDGNHRQQNGPEEQMWVYAADWGLDERTSLSHWDPVAGTDCEGKAVQPLIELHRADQRYQRLPEDTIQAMAESYASKLCTYLRDEHDCIDEFEDYIRDAEEYGVDFTYLHGPLGLN
jgi:hypothetical protein